MQAPVFRRCLTISLVVHILLAICINFLCLQQRVHKKFTVYGAYSSNAGKTIYKRSYTIPLVQQGKNQRSPSSSKQKKPRSSRTKKSVLSKQKNRSKKAIPQATKTRSQKKEPIASQAVAHGPTKKTNAKKKLPTKKAAQPSKKKTEAVQPPLPKAPEPVAQEILPNPPLETTQEINTTTTADAPAVEQPIENTPIQTPNEPEIPLTSLQAEAPEEEETDFYDFSEEVTEELEPLKLLVRDEIGRVWHPSIGIPRNTEAIVELVIDKIGKVDSHTFIQKSNILIYDKSIIMALPQMSFPQQLYGKKIVIRFKQ